MSLFSDKANKYMNGPKSFGMPARPISNISLFNNGSLPSRSQAVTQNRRLTTLFAKTKTAPEEALDTDVPSFEVSKSVFPDSSIKANVFTNFDSF